MFRRSPRTALLWVAALVVAIVTATTVISSVSSLRHQDRAYGSVRLIVVARRDLPIGTRVVAGDLATRHVRGEPPEPDTLTRTADAVGRIVRAPMLRGDLVTTRHLTTSRRAALSDIVPNGQRAVRLVIEHGLRPSIGDVIDVFATFDPATLGDAGDPTVLIAPAVSVLAVDAAPTGSDAVGVTVLVTPRQVSRLAFSASTGTLSIALAPPEAATAAG